MIRPFIDRVAMVLCIALISSVVAACTSKQEKTCASEQLPGGTISSPWTELGVAEGETCQAQPKNITWIVKHEKDPVAYSQRIQGKLEAKGWLPVEGTMNPNTYGKGGDAFFTIYGWTFKKGDQTLVMNLSSYPPDIWKDDPVKVSLLLK